MYLTRNHLQLRLTSPQPLLTFKVVLYALFRLLHFERQSQKVLKMWSVCRPVEAGAALRRRQAHDVSSSNGFQSLVPCLAVGARPRKLKIDASCLGPHGKTKAFQELCSIKLLAPDFTFEISLSLSLEVSMRPLIVMSYQASDFSDNVLPHVRLNSRQ